MKIKILAILSFIAYTSLAQTSTDYLRYSKNYFGGSARSLSMGGAFGAVGADISNMSTNPAGLGIYKKSDVLFSPSLFFAFAESNYQGVKMNDSKSNFNVGSYGFVFTTKGDPSNWNYFQFGMGVNRLNDYNNTSQISGSNHTTSLISDYQDQSYNVNPEDLDPFSTDLAWWTYLLKDTIRVNGGNLAYTSYLNKGGTLQQKEIRTWGSNNELSFSFSGSFQDKLYLGISMGIPIVRYHESSIYSELDDADTITSFKSFTMNNDLHTYGSGWNFKFGIIARPFGWARFGFAFHTPTYLYLTDEYSSSITSSWDSDPAATHASPFGVFDYEVVTPMKFIGSMAFTIEKSMILSADFEFLDYSNGEIRSYYTNFGSVNNDIHASYTNALNIHGGAEFNLEPLVLRVGGAWYGSPFAHNFNDGSVSSITAGFGYHQNGYYFDVAYVYSKKLEDYYLYNSDIVPAAHIKYQTNTVSFTFGTKF